MTPLKSELAAFIEKNLIGSERNITIKWDPAKLDETKVRTILSDLGKPVR